MDNKDYHSQNVNDSVISDPQANNTQKLPGYQDYNQSQDVHLIDTH